MRKFQTFHPAMLDEAGLNRQAIFDISRLPGELVQMLEKECASLDQYRQLILIGHGGRKLWECVCSSGIDSGNPIDDFTRQTIGRWFGKYQPDNIWEILYPGCENISLQRMGDLAGWHHPSPLGLGVDPVWGSWHAYRAVVLADTDFEPSRPVESDPPCRTCDHRACVASCPAGALEDGRMDLGKCVAYRKHSDAPCRDTCLARLGCPVGGEHRYCSDQIRHVYSISMAFIERFY